MSGLPQKFSSGHWTTVAKNAICVNIWLNFDLVYYSIFPN